MSAAAPASSATAGPATVWSRARGNVGFLTGAAICCALVLAAFLAPWIAPFDPNRQMAGPQLSDPTWAHWMGTDSFGRDTLSRVIWGARISLWVGVLATLLAMLTDLSSVRIES